MKITINRIGRDALEGGVGSLRAFCEKHKKDLAGADLRWANLSNANLRNADLSNANLSNADLRTANLSNANLSNADLRNADLTNAVLSWADLHNAVLSTANLSNANLSNANLSNADLSNTCLDPAAVIPVRDLSRWRRDDAGNLIGYRTRCQPHQYGADYIDGRYYRAPIFSIASTSCHPGLYASPTAEDVREEFPDSELIEVRIPPGMTHRADTKWRHREFTVVGKIKEAT